MKGCVNMKYTEEDLWKIVGKVFPTCETVRKNGVSLDLFDFLNKVIVYTTIDMAEDNLTNEEWEILKEALRDVYREGCFSY